MIVLAALLLLTAPAAAAAAGAAAPLPGLHEWEAGRADAARLLREIKADPARAQAARRLETQWRALDHAMQKVRSLQAKGQKVNQLTHSLIQVVKTLHELRQIGAKNLQ